MAWSAVDAYLGAVRAQRTSASSSFVLAGVAPFGDGMLCQEELVRVVVQSCWTGWACNLCGPVSRVLELSIAALLQGTVLEQVEAYRGLEGSTP